MTADCLSVMTEVPSDVAPISKPTTTAKWHKLAQRFRSFRHDTRMLARNVPEYPDEDAQPIAPLFARKTSKATPI
jgi:hypothetical protein